MKRNFLVLTIATMALASCNTNSTSEANIDTTAVETTIDGAHNSQNSLDYAGTYTGELPCADCEGIETQITLNEDGTFAKKMTYLGKGDNASFEEKGNYTWNTAGQLITLEGHKVPNQYFVGENTLTQLDIKGQKIEGELAALYVLKK